MKLNTNIIVNRVLTKFLRRLTTMLLKMDKQTKEK